MEKGAQKVEKKVPKEDEDKVSISSACSSSMAMLKMPKYDPSVSYDSEFYNLFIQNQNLMERLEQEAVERN